MIYGYCRVSNAKQGIERQKKNILAAYPTAEIVKEVSSGLKLQDMKELNHLLSIIQTGDTVVFDDIFRMSKDTKECYELYVKLSNQGIHLVFLQEPLFNI